MAVIQEDKSNPVKGITTHGASVAVKRVRHVPLLAFTLNADLSEGQNATIAVAGIGGPMCFDGNFIWAMNDTTGTSLMKIDITTNVVVANVSPGSSFLQYPTFDGSSVWISNFSAGTVFKINPLTNAVIATVTVGSQPTQMAFDGLYMWVSNQGGGSVSRINVGTNAVVATITGLTSPGAIAFDGKFIWVGGINSGAPLVKIDPSSNTVVTTISGVTGPIPSIAYDGTSMWVALASVGASTLRKVNVSTNTLTATVALTGANSNAQATVFDGTYIWSINNGSGMSSFQINPVTNAVVSNTLTSGIGATFDGTHLWVGVNTASNIIKTLVRTN